ncbi:hypothetical protein QL093DRAFT_2077911 [Fusarium oxysporum]|nr:hypothetical protein QL093DRAFT_2077911 [Fusarium oxysporum]
MNSKNLVDHFPALRLFFFFFEAGLNRTREGNVRVKRCEVGDGLDGPTLLLRSAVGGIDGQREKEKESKWWCRLSQRRTFCSKFKVAVNLEVDMMHGILIDFDGCSMNYSGLYTPFHFAISWWGSPTWLSQPETVPVVSVAVPQAIGALSQGPLETRATKTPIRGYRFDPYSYQDPSRSGSFRIEWTTDQFSSRAMSEAPSPFDQSSPAKPREFS